MKKLILIYLTLFAFSPLIFAQQQSTRIPNLEIPKTNPSEVIITHTGYSLVYSKLNELAKWVAYELTKEETNKIVDRIDKFIPDPQVKNRNSKR